jgi:hypothetical protein
MTTILIVSAIVAMFLLFGVTLACSDFYSRGATRNRTAARPKAAAEAANAIEHRKAA